MSDTSTSRSLFISYSHHDREAVVEIRSFLKSLESSGMLDVWCDERIHPGDPWESTIDVHLQLASAILLVVSEAFCASSFCQKELGLALEQWRTGKAAVFPFILAPCNWKATGIGDIQVLPSREGSAREVGLGAACLELADHLGRFAASLPTHQGSELDAEVERRFLRWIEEEMMAHQSAWHASPIVRVEGWSRKKRRRFARHDPGDRMRNPALADMDLSVRAGFGRRTKIRNLVRELRKYKNIVVLGDPGAGKSVCLRQLAYDLAVSEGKSSKRAKTLPLFLDMARYDQTSGGAPLPVMNFIPAHLLNLSTVRAGQGSHVVTTIMRGLPSLLNQGRVTGIFDALDEMPQASYHQRFEALKEFSRAWSSAGNAFVFSCRTFDYDASFDVDEVLIEPFSRSRIRAFLEEHAPHLTNIVMARIAEDEALEEMVSNPFLLQALAYINLPWSDQRRESIRFPDTRGGLIRIFAEELLIREQGRTVPIDVPRLRRCLSRIAFALQERREGGSSIPLDVLTTTVFPDEPDLPRLLWLAQRARILGKRGEPSDTRDQEPGHFEPPATVEFVHHRLQEYFAAVALAEEFSGAASDRYLDDIWWHETIIMAVGIVDEPAPLLDRILRRSPETRIWAEQVLSLIGAQKDAPLPKAE